jgi:hypothetical protein
MLVNQQMRELYRRQNIKKLTKSTSQKSDPHHRFFWKSIAEVFIKKKKKNNNKKLIKALVYVDEQLSV